MLCINSKTVKAVYFDATLCIRKNLQFMLQFKKKKISQIIIKLNINIWYGYQHAEDKKELLQQ